MLQPVRAPLTTRLSLATEVLRPFIDGVEEVTAVHIEHTPAGEIFGDQTSVSGVDCDVLVEGWTIGGRLVHGPCGCPDPHIHAPTPTVFLHPPPANTHARPPDRGERGPQFWDEVACARRSTSEANSA